MSELLLKCSVLNLNGVHRKEPVFVSLFLTDLMYQFVYKFCVILHDKLQLNIYKDSILKMHHFKLDFNA